jgi:hypothetical protein
MCSTCGGSAYGTNDPLRRCRKGCPVRIAAEAEKAAKEAAARAEAHAWRAEHLGDFVLAVQDCADVQTLRALAHRLGYKEGT